MLPAVLAVALAQSPPAGPGEPFHDALSTAKEALYEGDHEGARELLRTLAARLDGGEDPGRSLAAEALVFLGDLELLLGEKERARAVFRVVLLEEPDHVISPYDHGEDVRALFALVREDVRRELAARAPVDVPEVPALPPPPPFPATGYLPFGAPQAAQGRSGPALGFGVGQVATATGSLVAYALINRSNHRPDDARSIPRGRVQALRYGVQFPLTFAFYGLWGASVLDARRHWRSQRPLEGMENPSPGQ